MELNLPLLLILGISIIIIGYLCCSGKIESLVVNPGTASPASTTSTTSITSLSASSTHPQQYTQIIELADHKTLAKILQGDPNSILILIHGTPIDQRSWEPIVQEIASRGKNSTIPTVITYDIRGFGTAADIPIANQFINANDTQIAWPLEEYANDLLTVINTLVGTSTKVQIAGWAFGGAIAQKFALIYPQRIEKLFLISTMGAAIPEARGMVDSLYNDWISPNSHVDYLTLSATDIQSYLCRWFNIVSAVCPTNTATDKMPPVDDTDDALWSARTMMTVANSRAQLQFLKIMSVYELLSDWEAMKNIPFQIQLLSAEYDDVSFANGMTKLWASINQVCPGCVHMQPVAGTHYYIFQHPCETVNMLLSPNAQRSC